MKLNGLTKKDRPLSNNIKHQFETKFKIFISRSNTKSIKYWNINFGSFYQGFYRGYTINTPYVSLELQYLKCQIELKLWKVNI